MEKTEEIRSHLLMVLNDAVQFIYEETGKDFNELPEDLKRVVFSILEAESAVLRQL